MVTPTRRAAEAMEASMDEDPIEAAFLGAPLDETPESDAERAMMAEALAQPDAWVSDEEHRATLAGKRRNIHRRIRHLGS